MIRPPGLRCACLPCSTYCSSTPARAKRHAPRPDDPLTHFASPRGETCRLRLHNFIRRKKGCMGSFGRVTPHLRLNLLPAASPHNPANGAALSQPACFSTRLPKHAIRAPGLRCACLPCSTYCEVRLRAPSGTRLVLTALSRTSPRHVVRKPQTAPIGGTGRWGGPSPEGPLPLTRAFSKSS